MAQIDYLQTTVANLEVERNNFNESNERELARRFNRMEELRKDNDKISEHNFRLRQLVDQEVNKLKALSDEHDSLKSSINKLMEVLKSKDQLIAKQEQLIANQKKEFEFLQKNLNDTICHLRTKLDEKINAVKALTSALDKKILATEPVKRKYVRKEAKK
jgi:phosphoglycerate-specific signal transduction histidine kinase